ncbi:hypothetical protein C1Y18_21680 [Pseudomonas sp. MPR-R5A]|nr:hypothetical protein C1Y25_21895 [Pseudomonas sp. MPBC4-3]PMX45531.1 hypothetical protein C1Y20_20300 [Pseudomonas sp. FW301-21B01]PMY04766.1 hypothetical protein C1Y18_21680 [Pseudomonas sp. MPR-R5A]PNA66371.1 hypothetical protein C1Y14_20610 [Pseudomonas sp. MPR-R5B]
MQERGAAWILLANLVNADARSLNKRAVLTFFASKLAPTGRLGRMRRLFRASRESADSHARLG